jgi:SpoVK/Ycf46/Vps4 family AAA+-type ATPase
VEVAKFFRLRSRVDEEWGFGRMVNGTGLRALFTGDPGTGKTLSAEVIAGLLGLPLYKVDLARIVSKWVGETEKNLESAFCEAEESHSVLFFDEAEALFGKRAEVQHGTDRYANLEVSFLLQRIETSRGLVILASNVVDQIDPAFIRRFQVVVHFSRPGLPERRRIWQLAFPSAAPLDPELDLDALARLDMTGAAIVSAARTAALLVADSGASTISMAHVIHAVARQFRREARILTPADLGPYGVLLQGAS